ncbi:anti-sigma factor RsbA family regulatory protein [Actinomadura rugatobispora]|uniref:Anti-sigma factor RsbA family regulatory protein n=1 Tax=Actinomadura rugatobispora TaxID=1994 RepID=A0ABW1A4N0_9ACTN|nr:sensor histidine kinase [Actinomadura rugatobispora]
MTLEHRAFLYDGVEEFLSVTAPYLREGVEAGEAVVVVVREPGLSALRDVLAPLAAEIEFYDSAVFYRHPVRTLKSYQEVVVSKMPRPVRALAEPVWQGRSPRETVEWARYESLINVVFEDSGARALCPYDLDGLPSAVIDHARRTHPLLACGAHSAGYVDPVAFGEECDRTRRFDRPRETAYFAVESDDLYALRVFVGGRAGAHGLGEQPARNFVTAVNEVAANALRHGAPPVGVRVWSEGPDLVCEVGDNGLWLPGPGPLTGFVPPESALERGFGLWSVRLLVDLMELRAGWDGTFVRLRTAR